MSQAEYQTDLIDDIASFTHDPLSFCKYAFPWGEKGTEFETYKGVRPWQEEILTAIGDHLQNPDTRHDVLQLAVASGHGIGKSALIGMIINWALATCEDTRVRVTANTFDQLTKTTVPEATKWAQASIVSGWFTNTATAMYSNCKGHEKAWRCDFIPWSKENTAAFAGLHNKDKRIVYIFDEASGIHQKIWEVAEGALTDEDTEIIFIAFGNPTENTGRFRECFRKYGKYWKTWHIDSRDVEGTDTKFLNRIIEQYGEDSDQARVRVKGQFPNQSAYQFYGQDLIDAAYDKHLREEQYNFAPTIISCDPAWTGSDDLVIGMRQGLKYEVLHKLPKNDNDVQIANLIARYQDKYKADAVFIDGGFGQGIVSAGRTMGRDWQLVWFNEKSLREDCVNKRAEMYVQVKDWLKEGGAIPPDDELKEEMQAIELEPTLDGKYKIKSKEKIKEILGRSPNQMDALAITFAFPVQPNHSALAENMKRRRQREEYNPMR